MRQRTPGEPLRPGRPTPWCGPTARSGPSRRSVGTTRRRSSTASGAGRGSGRTPIPDPEECPADHRASSPGRPGPPRPAGPARRYSYTNNWPPEPLVGNHADRGGGRLERPVAHRPARRHRAACWRSTAATPHLLGWHGTEERRLRFVPPAQVAADPGPAVHRLVLLRRRGPVPAAERCSAARRPTTTPRPAASSASTCARLLPYNLTRTWHLQLALFFVAAAFLAAGIFLAPLIAGREPRGQRLLSLVLLGALVVVVVGSLAGEASATTGYLTGADRPLLRGPGVGVPRPRQVLAVPAGRRHAPLAASSCTAGSGRGWRPRAAATCRGCSSTAPCRSRSSTRSAWSAARRPPFAIADFWRFWVVHLWVEDFLELFTTMMVAYIFVLLGVVSERMATRVIYFDVILYSVGGVVGTMHHFYFSGGAGGPHGPGGVLLGGGGDPADAPDGRGLDLPAAGGRQQVGGGRTGSRTAGRCCSWPRSASGTSSGPASSAS